MRVLSTVTVEVGPPKRVWDLLADDFKFRWAVAGSGTAHMSAVSAGGGGLLRGMTLPPGFVVPGREDRTAVTALKAVPPHSPRRP